MKGNSLSLTGDPNTGEYSTKTEMYPPLTYFLLYFVELFGNFTILYVFMEWLCFFFFSFGFVHYSHLYGLKNQMFTLNFTARLKFMTTVFKQIGSISISISIKLAVCG